MNCKYLVVFSSIKLSIHNCAVHCRRYCAYFAVLRVNYVYFFSLTIYWNVNIKMTNLFHVDSSYNHEQLIEFVIWVVFGRESRDHMTSLLRDRLHWLHVCECVTFTLRLLVYKALHKGPGYLADMLVWLWALATEPLCGRQHEETLMFHEHDCKLERVLCCSKLQRKTRNFERRRKRYAERRKLKRNVNERKRKNWHARKCSSTWIMVCDTRDLYHF